jgi:hypothetical protein
MDSNEEQKANSIYKEPNLRQCSSECIDTVKKKGHAIFI